MTKDERSWSVRLTSPAEADFHNIIAWTLEQFGDRQAIIYAETLSSALDALTTGPTTVGVIERTDIGKGLFTLHVARSDRKGRHLVLFRVGADRERSIEVLRVLHDAMDMGSHVPAAGDV